jgi:hypothetical protein
MARGQTCLVRVSKIWLGNPDMSGFAGNFGLEIDVDE